MTVLSRLAIAAGLLVALPRVAHAELDGGAMFVFDQFKTFDTNGDAVDPGDVEAQGRYFNLAHCQCAKAGQGTQQKFQYTVSLSSQVSSSAIGEAWVGTECDNDELRPDMCRRASAGADTASLTTLSSMPQEVQFNFYEVLNGLDTAPEDACIELEESRTFYYLVNTVAGGTYEHEQPQTIGDDLTIDTWPPPIPDSLVATGGEQSIQLSWQLTSDRFDDIETFQAFCSRDGAPVGTASVTPKYQTSNDVCGVPFTFEATASSVASGSRGEVVEAMPAEFSQLDRTFLCGEASKGSTELRINGLENGVAYKVALVMVDLEGNYTATYFGNEISPIEVTDLWEDIHGDGDGPQGGCLSTARDDAGGPLSGLLVAGAIGGLVLWRRRRKLAVAGALLLASGSAQADDFAPYWEQDEANDRTNFYQEEDIRWHIGIRVGPYIPDIDGQAGKNATTGKGPYESMFGDYYVPGDAKARTAYVWQVLPMLDVDYVLLRGFGQLTIGGSVGYMQQSALAYAAGTSPDDPMRVRAPGNETVFRMVPTQLAVGYRVTQLSDTYGIPIVPYVRGGLAYYMWLMRAPNGDLSSVCETEADPCPSDSRNKAKGGTFGLVGSVGISIRAENIDRDSARSMRETGVDHAGFYAELSYGKVDGFGSSDKLSLGDLTWFAGVDFEF